ncbi:hypothetical protein [Wenjunlia tyrosinilytica]|uniref:Uncharacterized protein n=1 Tax=Wenjunlia tyrosinilytica TaxID=1544741 RepID=A0A917ZQL4_9ACTN|nr:hypothetical protein [Wenjunlia tyrosinilytica]GGO87841.1 hypothetical protein GCM10012280_27240 [Wenjunlia tyrosinilytica]
MELNGVLRPLADDLPREVRELVRFLRTLMASLGTSPERYSAWALHDRRAMDRYLEGSQLPPLDVVVTLIHDLAEHRGLRLGPDGERQARELHASAVQVIDSRPGRVRELHEELAEMVDERDRLAERERALLEVAQTSRASVQAGSMGHAEYRGQLIRTHDELSRARALHTRARARCEELEKRVAAAERVERSAPAARPTGARFAGAFSEAGPQAWSDPGADAQARRLAAAEQQPTGARFAGAHSNGRRRGAHKSASAGKSGANAPARSQERTDYAGYTEARELAENIARLREEGKAQEAQSRLWEAMSWSPEYFPALCAALGATGQRADVATLLWELSSRSPQEVAAYSVWLVKAGMEADWRELLGQASLQPHGDVAAMAMALVEAGWHEQSQVLLGSVVRTRTPEAVAELVAQLRHLDAAHCLRDVLVAVDAAARDRRLQVTAALRLAGLPESARELPDSSR